jgi:putative PIN family toxin of toxin-antitoxin system
MGKVESKRVVIDTNVVVSALLFGGIPGKLIKLWKSGDIQPLASKEIIDEYLKVLAYPKFELSEEEIKFLLYHEILPYFEATEAKTTQVIIQNDPSDDKFIQCAMTGNARIVISGDEHLLALRSYQGIKILPPSQFLKDLSQQPMDS